MKHDINAVLIWIKKCSSVEASNYYAALETKKRRRELYQAQVKSLLDGCVTTVLENPWSWKVLYAHSVCR